MIIFTKKEAYLVPDMLPFVEKNYELADLKDTILPDLICIIYW